MMQQFAVKKSNGVARARVRGQNALGRKTGQKHHGKWEKMGQNQEEEKIGRESEQSGKKAEIKKGLLRAPLTGRAGYAEG